MAHSSHHHHHLLLNHLTIYLSQSIPSSSSSLWSSVFIRTEQNRANEDPVRCLQQRRGFSILHRRRSRPLWQLRPPCPPCQQTRLQAPTLLSSHPFFKATPSLWYLPGISSIPMIASLSVYLSMYSCTWGVCLSCFSSCRREKLSCSVSKTERFCAKSVTCRFTLSMSIPRSMIGS